jgi:hypothetical protein
MPLTFEKLRPHFAAEVGPIDLRRVTTLDIPEPVSTASR